MDRSDMPVVAKIGHNDQIYLVRRDVTYIGRGPIVDLDLGHSKRVSRRHIDLFYEHPNFYLRCNSRNGLYVDDLYLIQNAPILKLPKT